MQMLMVKIKRKKDAVEILCCFFNFSFFILSIYICMYVLVCLIMFDYWLGSEIIEEGGEFFKNWDMLIDRIISELVRNMDRIYCLISIHNTY